MQSYLSTMTDIGVDTWIIHGTLLGWWWNRQVRWRPNSFQLQSDRRRLIARTELALGLRYRYADESSKSAIPGQLLQYDGSHPPSARLPPRNQSELRGWKLQ